MTIGQKIQAARKKAKYTQKELAQLCGVATGTIQQYELGKRQPRIEQLKKIANILNISIIDFFATEEYDELAFEFDGLNPLDMPLLDDNSEFMKEIRPEIEARFKEYNANRPADVSIRFPLTDDVKERQNKYDSIIEKHKNGEPYTEEELKFIEEMNATLPDKMEQLAEKLHPIINRIQETTMKLNEKGMEKVAEHAEMIAKIPEYQRNFNSDNTTET